MSDNEMLLSHGARVAEYTDAKKRLSVLRGNVEQLIESYARAMEQVNETAPQDYRSIVANIESLAAPGALAGYLIESADLAASLLRAKRQLSGLGLETAEDCLEPVRPRDK